MDPRSIMEYVAGRLPEPARSTAYARAAGQATTTDADAELWRQLQSVPVLREMWQEAIYELGGEASVMIEASDPRLTEYAEETGLEQVSEVELRNRATFVEAATEGAREGLGSIGAWWSRTTGLPLKWLVIGFVAIVGIAIVNAASSAIRAIGGSR